MKWAPWPHSEHKDFAQWACGFGTMAKSGRPKVRPPSIMPCKGDRKLL